MSAQLIINITIVEAKMTYPTLTPVSEMAEIITAIVATYRTKETWILRKVLQLIIIERFDIVSPRQPISIGAVPRPANDNDLAPVSTSCSRRGRSWARGALRGRCA